MQRNQHAIMKRSFDSRNATQRYIVCSIRARPAFAVTALRFIVPTTPCLDRGAKNTGSINGMLRLPGTSNSDLAGKIVRARSGVTLHPDTSNAACPSSRPVAATPGMLHTGTHSLSHDHHCPGNRLN